MQSALISGDERVLLKPVETGYVLLKRKKSIKFTAINHLIRAFPYVYALQMLLSMVLQLA